MATPAGYIDAGDGGWPVDSRNSYETWIPLDMMHHIQPMDWLGPVLKRYYTSVYWRPYIPAGTSLECKATGWPNNIDGTQSTDGAFAAWEELSEIAPRFRPEGVPPGTGEQLNQYTFTPSNTEPCHDQLTLYCYNGDSTTCDVCALYVETESLLAYGSSDPAGEGYVEVMGRNTDADSWRPYEALRPASSWLAKRALTQTYSRTLYEARQAWSVIL